MDNVKEVLTDAVKVLEKEVIIENREKEQELNFKRDCRRTALQLSERTSQTAEKEREHDPAKIIENANVYYEWLTDIT